MFIAQAFKVRHEFWRYLVGSVLIIIASVIGQLPLGGIFALKALEDGMDLSTLDEKSMYTLLDSNLFLFLMLISFVAGMIGLYFVVRYIHDQTFLSVTTSRKKIDWKRIWFAFIFWGVVSSALIALDYYMSPEDYVYNFQLKRFAILAVIAIALIPIQTSLEEYIFRGYLMQGFGTLAKNRWFPLLMTSVIFGGLHLFNPEVKTLGYIIMVYYIGTGLFLGIMTLMDEGMELALGFHAANNLFTALLVTADWTAFQTHSVLKDTSDPTAAGLADVFVPVLVLFPILLFIFSKVYKWTNWKEKLFGTIEEPPKEDYKILGEDCEDTNLR